MNFMQKIKLILLIVVLGSPLLKPAAAQQVSSMSARSVHTFGWQNEHFLLDGKTVSDYLGRHALRACAAPILARPNEEDEGDGLEYLDDLRLLEPALQTTDPCRRALAARRQSLDPFLPRRRPRAPASKAECIRARYAPPIRGTRRARCRVCPRPRRSTRAT